MFSSPLYWSGYGYDAGIKLMHGRSLRLRYRYLSDLSDESVLDVGCGTGSLVDHLPDKSRYLGIDLNERFIKFAKKKGRNVIKQDALTFDRFSDFDVCVIMDVLHHIKPHHEEFIERVLRDVRKRVVICEPFDDPGRNRIHKNLIKIVDYDGTNWTDEEWMDKGSLLKFYEGFNPVIVDEVGQSIVAVYEKSARAPV
jgi:SAM-dependent methyltransferase